MRYTQALHLKVIGIPQRHSPGANYYINDQMVVAIEDFNAIKDCDFYKVGQEYDHTEFVYIPTLQDLFDFLGNNFGEMRIMSDGKVCVYAREPLQNSNETVRASGMGIEDALVNLIVTLYEEKGEVLQFKSEDVLRVSKNSALFLGGIKLSQTEIDNLKAEVKYFRSLRLHSIFMETVRDQARLTMFERAQNFDDMRSGKAILHAIGVLENILNTVEKNAGQVAVKPSVLKSK